MIRAVDKRLVKWKGMQRNSSAASSGSSHPKRAEKPANKGAAVAAKGTHGASGTHSNQVEASKVGFQAPSSILNEGLGVSGEHIAEYIYAVEFGWGKDWDGQDKGVDGKWLEGVPRASKLGKLSAGGGPKTRHTQMNNITPFLLATMLLAGSTCSNAGSLPYDAWRLGFSAPDYMEVWIETADVVDMKGQVYRRAMSGVSAIQTPENNKGNPKGWPKKSGWGKGKYVTNADLPKKIYVRWQSLVEPQTYQVGIDIAESTREIMRTSEKTYCAATGKWTTGYRKAIAIGLAPGGIVKVWVLGPCLTPLEVMRLKAEVDTRGTYEGKSGGQYDSLSEISRMHVKKFGVPYGSW